MRALEEGPWWMTLVCAVFSVDAILSTGPGFACCFLAFRCSVVAAKRGFRASGFVKGYGSGFRVGFRVQEKKTCFLHLVHPG